MELNLKMSTTISHWRVFLFQVPSGFPYCKFFTSISLHYLITFLINNRPLFSFSFAFFCSLLIHDLIFQPNNAPFCFTATKRINNLFHVFINCDINKTRNPANVCLINHIHFICCNLRKKLYFVNKKI